MAKIEFQLEHGIPFGKGCDAEVQYDVQLRELEGADVIDAALEAERVVFVDDGKKAIAYTSDVLYGFELLRRQIKCIGDIQGPISLKELKKFHPADLERLQEKAAQLDTLLQDVAERGRD